MRLAELFFAFLAAVVFAFAPPAAEADDVSAFVKSVQKKYSSINDFSSPFTQETLVASMEEKVLSSGRVWFKKPAMMRWEYEKPWKDRIVSDGEKVWHFSSRENQVTETSLNESWNTLGSHTLLSIMADLESLFDVSRSEKSPEEEGNVLLNLRQKDRRDDSRKVSIAVSPKTLLLKKIIIEDAFGNTTVINLGAAELNRGVADSLFTFVKPEGARTVTFP